MSVDPEPGTELILPHSGELVSLTDTAAVCRALDELRDLEIRVRELKAMLTDAVVDESRRQGSKTLHLPGNLHAEVKGGEKVLWDAQQLESDLRDLGMPEERIREIVVEEVSYTVAAAKAKQAARANEDYAAAVESARTVVEVRPSVSVKRGL